MSNPAGLRQTEKDFQAAVVEYARLNGWLCYHTYDSRRSEPGFPDIVAVRERSVFIELKSEIGRLSIDQDKWLTRLEKAGAEVHVWKPSDWPEIEATLKRRTPEAPWWSKP